MSYSIVEGDLEPDLNLTVNEAGVAKSLVGATAVDLRWRKPDNTVSVVALTVVSAAAGTVRRVWVAGDTDQTGVHRGQVVVTWAGGEQQTFPNDGSHVRWNVFPALT